MASYLYWYLTVECIENKDRKLRSKYEWIQQKFLDDLKNVCIQMGRGRVNGETGIRWEWGRGRVNLMGRVRCMVGAKEWMYYTYVFEDVFHDVTPDVC